MAWWWALNVLWTVGILGRSMSRPGSEETKHNAGALGQIVSWEASDQERRQDNFTCPSGQQCDIMTITSNCTLYRCKGSFEDANTTVAPGCVLTIHTRVNMCSKGQCHEGGIEWTTITANKEMRITNGTPITGRGPMDWLIRGESRIPKHQPPSMTSLFDVRICVGDSTNCGVCDVVTTVPKVHHTHLAPIASTCQAMASTAAQTNVHWQVRLPVIPECNPKRRRRAWYDTLLGGAGTVMGISNAIDSEVTRTKLSSTGQATAQGLYTIGRWMPSAMMTQEETARILLHSLKWELDVWDSTQRLFQNFTVQMNWTICGIQMLHAHLQKERFLRIVTSPNVQAWRGVWNVSEKLWMNTYPDKTWCNATLCKGHFVTLNVTDFVTVCRYYVLPVITSDGYYFLKTKGNWFSPDTNLTYDLSACEQADQGKACLLMDRYRDPCLTEDTALCEWIIEAPRDMMWQIGPHTLCVATSHAHALLPTTPFSGCLTGIYRWRWQNHTYLLTNYSGTQHLTTMQWQVWLHPWSISLERFKQALDRSEELKQILRQHQINVTRVTVSTFIHGQKVVHAAHVVEVESAHHWWDLFNGLSTTARRSLFPPLFILIGVLVILTCCNILTCTYVCRVRQQLEQNMYML
ncbi:uncharacterized protein LOC121289097 [Carcharodon carcharias]|uniref:uncharacterized protein LOC121289097 n=1 Tax=Carcharodon carcharias TaxID=13397 RepID=UPI001B7E977F|nr:uncharacterized protein LOC121289097 [Carcharodon carcharias]